ncbi:hypothetical protein OUZ56_026443 [Daphnia magna]|uniref:Uncharacterized protein n=1 Tax=Daphnia magna TaxID=35525 RepID=A0ABQ9ZLX1_9CRUS|nr:hypothetical protein OUZ56_026443 [Daphnia magna]
MYSVVWDRLDAVYGRIEIPPVKNQDVASLKTFANRLHGAVVTLSQSRYAYELHSRTTLIAIEAKLTTSFKEKWREKRKRTGAELNVLDLDDWIVPVRISVGARWVDTFRFLDTESDTTLIRSDVVKKLGLVGQPKPINVCSYKGATSNVQALVVNFSLSSVDGTSRFEVKHAFAVDNFKVTLNP